MNYITVFEGDEAVLKFISRKKYTIIEPSANKVVKNLNISNQRDEKRNQFFKAEFLTAISIKSFSHVSQAI